ncbi:hypothetical protein EV188_102513 [Actinomycetospora succinea]|uniref:Uncharacterized protein n=1 Tax=Actinomycetospora succinea TaxID=663603 RepID=A0A4R6VHY0_9PSEU|nr:hypothetical protein [Actinomycetospora succinea]TDQ62857.1 hypothetical protein EV188_102513 [Actinomycetospora succinea]
MIAAVIITALLTVIAAQTRAVGAAVVLGVITVALLAVVAPDLVTGFGHVLGAIATGIGDALSSASADAS